MLKTRVISVTNTPVVVASSTVAADSTAALTLAGATLMDTTPILLYSTQTTPVWFGGSSMTTASTNLGIPFIGNASPGAYMTYNLLASDPLFAITTGAGPVTILAQGGRQS